MRLPAFFSLCLLGFLFGCASSARYANTDYGAATKYCFDQAEWDKIAHPSEWFTRWLTCHYERAMPIEIYAFPSKENEIKEMYKRLFVLAKQVDLGEIKVQAVYAEWDRMQKEIKMGECTIRTVGPDGSEHCFSWGSTK